MGLLLLDIERYNGLSLKKRHQLVQVYKEGILQNAQYRAEAAGGDWKAYNPRQMQEAIDQEAERYYRYFNQIFLEKGEQWVACWEQGDVIVAAMRIIHNGFNADFWLFEGVETHPDFRRLGISKKLLAHAIEAMKCRDYRVPQIGYASNIRFDNLASIGLHESLGFVASDLPAVDSHGDISKYQIRYVLSL